MKDTSTGMPEEIAVYRQTTGQYQFSGYDTPLNHEWTKYIRADLATPPSASVQAGDVRDAIEITNRAISYQMNDCGARHYDNPSNARISANSGLTVGVLETLIAAASGKVPQEVVDALKKYAEVERTLNHSSVATKALKLLGKDGA